MIDYSIIGTGSSGNAVVVKKMILIDCGVPFKALEGVYRGLSLVLLTHIHGDHFSRATIRRLASERPLLRFGCGEWLAAPLLECGVSAEQIDVYQFDRRYTYQPFELQIVPLVHNVPNCGYKIRFADGSKMIYATDTNNLNGIRAKGYDLYMIEANFDEDEIQQRIDGKKMEGQYAYEYQVLHNHLSRQKCDDFIYRNIRPGGVYVYMHQHQEKERQDNV